MDFSIPLQGLDRAEQQFNPAATRIAKTPLPGDPVDMVDLSAEVVSLMEAKNNFAANARLIHAADELTRSLLDVLA